MVWLASTEDRAHVRKVKLLWRMRKNPHCRKWDFWANNKVHLARFWGLGRWTRTHVQDNNYFPLFWKELDSCTKGNVLRVCGGEGLLGGECIECNFWKYETVIYSPCKWSNSLWYNPRRDREVYATSGVEKAYDKVPERRKKRNTCHFIGRLWKDTKEEEEEVGSQTCTDHILAPGWRLGCTVHCLKHMSRQPLFQVSFMFNPWVFLLHI